MAEAVLESKLSKMRDILRSLRRVAVAFSGGVDSTFLLKVAVDTLGSADVLAVTADSGSLPRSELAQARRLSEQIGVELVVVTSTEMDDPDYAANPPNRCYYCKKALYTHIQKVAGQRQLKWIVCGTNLDDYQDYRPGHQAGKEHGVRAPCAEAELGKQDIRTLSRQMGLPTFDKPASPCLASRIAYGDSITVEKLQRVEHAEEFLRQLGLRECRVRHHGNLARIEVPPERIPELMQPEVRSRIEQRLRQIGYSYVTMDLRGFRSGSMNEVILSAQGGDVG